MSPVLGLLQFTHSRKAAFAIWCFDLTTEFQPGMLNLPLLFLPVGLIAEVCVQQSYYLPRCLRSTVKCGKTPTTVTWCKPLKMCCHGIVTQQRPTVEPSARKLRNLLLPVKERTKVHHCITPERWIWLVCSVSFIQANKLPLQELNKLNRNWDADFRFSRNF